MLIRRFEHSDAAEVSSLIRTTLRISNSRDYASEYIEQDAQLLTPEYVTQRAQWTHFYMVCEANRIVGCGAIGPYWNKEDESSLFNIFVLPECQGKGYGRAIIDILEQDEFFLCARRIEIPSSITACSFYQKMGYACKNGGHQPDEEQLCRLE